MTDYTICAPCASDERCEHAALEPGLPRWEVEVEQTMRFRFGVLAATKEEAEEAASEAVDETWEPDSEDEWVTVQDRKESP